MKNIIILFCGAALILGAWALPGHDNGLTASWKYVYSTPNFYQSGVMTCTEFHCEDQAIGLVMNCKYETKKRVVCFGLWKPHTYGGFRALIGENEMRDIITGEVFIAARTR